MALWKLARDYPSCLSLSINAVWKTSWLRCVSIRFRRKEELCISLSLLPLYLISWGWDLNFLDPDVSDYFLVCWKLYYLLIFHKENCYLHLCGKLFSRHSASWTYWMRLSVEASFVGKKKSSHCSSCCLRGESHFNRCISSDSGAAGWSTDCRELGWTLEGLIQGSRNSLKVFLQPNDLSWDSCCIWDFAYSF